MPSNTATANSALRVSRGGKRTRTTSTKPATKTSAPKKPTKPATIAAKGQLTAVLDAAKSEPVVITLNGKPAADILNPRTYRQLEKLLHKIAEEEENHWCIQQWEKAVKEGFVGPEKSAAFTRKMRDAFNA